MFVAKEWGKGDTTCDHQSPVTISISAISTVTSRHGVTGRHSAWVPATATVHGRSYRIYIMTIGPLAPCVDKHVLSKLHIL